jgi:hypothetical protein
MVNAGGATSVTVSNLIAGRAYYFAATCYTLIGLESQYSMEVAYLVPTNVPPPGIVVQPPSATTNAFGTNLTITVISTGGAGYQWLKNSTITLTNGGNLSGVNSSSLVISNLSWLDNGIYSLRITNSAGATNSSGETVYVSPPAVTNIRVTSP